jgi:hypothetical protein
MSAVEPNFEELMIHLDDIIETLKRYVKQGIPTGDFLRAFLANDLMGAVGRADMMNKRLLPEIATYIYNHVPMPARGHYKTVDDWIKGGGQEGLSIKL